MLNLDNSQSFSDEMTRMKNDICQLVERGKEFTDSSVVEKSQKLDEWIVSFMKDQS
ncbi:Spo0E family sporulation regulatory protein-aspartic acid phosphatase [Sporohalobacter salinus]|uniref:Spo0E family sporulation regulatory protein-aspartic acid phosphatase n=1 Tax=Sporohalobacter salinus TaxID=1494606 RepID=UPI00195F33CA|nr:hypothetical protein [Sporohalobacter salinus]